MSAFVAGLAWLSLLYVLAYHLAQAVMLAVAWASIRRSGPTARLLRTAAAAQSMLPGVSVVIPAYNEEATIARTVQSVLATTFDRLEVVVVIDGATDQTFSALWDAFDLVPIPEEWEQVLPTQRVRAVFASRTHPSLRVVDKRNGGKADALNAGINVSSHDLVLAIDADVTLDPSSLARLAAAFVLDPDVVAATGTIRPLNGCRIDAGRIVPGLGPSLLEQLQTLEYIRAYGWGRRFFSAIDGHVIISGALGLFSRTTLMELGGYQTHAIGEDMEIVVRLHRRLRESGRPYRIAFVEEALCLTELPPFLKDLGAQRTRWHQGLLTTLRVHRPMLLSPAYGRIGLVSLPYFWFELATPPVEALSWAAVTVGLAAGIVSAADVLPLLALSIALAVATSLLAVWLDLDQLSFYRRRRDYLVLLRAALVEPFWYHQLTVVFRCRAFVRYYSGLHLKSTWRSPRRLSRDTPRARPAPVGRTEP